MSAATTLAGHWDALANVALLGAGRRPAPEPPSGIAAELADERRPSDDGEAVLDQVGLLGALRRGGIRPGPPRPLLVPAPVDPRPACSPRAVALLHDIVTEWPVLLDEWLARLVDGGRRLAPELVVPMLARFRSDPPRRAAILAAAGPLGEWVVELFPEQLAARQGGIRTVAEPPGPLPADIARYAEFDAELLASSLAAGLERGELSNRHRPMLVRLLCLVSPAVLPTVAAALHRAGSNPATMGLALGLADLTSIRHSMIQELLP